MTEIHVESAGEETWHVRVEEGGGATEHVVSVPPDQRKRYGGGADAADLVEASFRFLLEREPKEAILPRFELSTIEGYFPEYPEVIRDRVG